MYIATVPNRSSPPAILLRESFRENGKVKSRTLANLSKLPKQALELRKRHITTPNATQQRAFDLLETIRV